MTYLLYRLAVWLAPRAPPRFGYWLAARVGDLVYLVQPASRAQYERNLRRVVTPGTSPKEFARLVRHGFQNLFKNYFDLFRGQALTSAQVRAQMAEMIGLEHLEGALALKKGVLGGAAHFGNFDMVIHLVADHFREQYKVVVPMEHLNPEKLHAFVVKLREAQGIEMVAIENAPRVILKTLRAGNFVGLAIDRNITASGTVVDFFGEPARLPDGGVQLALKFNLPFIVAFSRRRADNRSIVTLEPALWFEKTGNNEKDVRAGVEKIARVMEKWFRAYPDQWLMFVPFWEADRQSATSGQPST